MLAESAMGQRRGLPNLLVSMPPWSSLPYPSCGPAIDLTALAPQQCLTFASWDHLWSYPAELLLRARPNTQMHTGNPLRTPFNSGGPRSPCPPRLTRMGLSPFSFHDISIHRADSPKRSAYSLFIAFSTYARPTRAKRFRSPGTGRRTTGILQP
jgi:hypothetical protein